MDNDNKYISLDRISLHCENSNAIKHNLTLDQGLAQNTDINTLTTPGSFICANGSLANTLVNWPATGAGGRLEVISVLRTIGAQNQERLRQIVLVNNGYEIYQRYWNGSTWSSWEKQPSRSEVDALSGKLTLSSKTTSVNAWTNDTNAVLEIIGTTKKFSITIASDGTLSGSVTNL